MKKLKERLKRGLALMMAAASIVSVLPSMNVSAASQTAKITFAYCHDGAGNAIRYQQTVTHDGRVCGEAGEARTRIYADGEPAFCIQPGVPLHTGNTLQANASETWNALSGSQRDAVNLALLYGSQGSMGSLPGSEDEKVVATQMVIWEIVTGCRNANAPYNQTDSKFYNSICANGANGGVSAAYSQIVAGMQEHGTIPSFASTDRNAVVKELSWDGDKYVVKLTDTNGVLSKYNFTSSNSSVSVSASGNTLTITSQKAVTGDVLLSATKRSPAVSGTLVAYGDASLQDVVVGVESAADITVYLSVKIPYGHVQIVKTSEDGIVEGLRFQITGSGINKTVVTGKNGKIKVENLNPGTYTVTELTEDRYEPQKSQKVTVAGGQTAKVEFSNILKRGDLKVIKGSEDNLVEGVRFHLYGTSLSGAMVDEYAVTDRNGVAMFSNILISGSTPYTLEEVDTAVRYVIPKKQSVTIKWKEVTSATVTNILKKFRVNVTKTDRETGEPQGDATLAGAVYGIYDGDTLIDTYTTDSEGKFTTKYYICGNNWSVREITPSEGYLLDETVHHVGAEPENYAIELNTTSNDVQEQVIKGRISIIKHTDDGSTQIETPEDPKANNAYGTHRANAYKIIEDTLNLRDTRVYDYIPTEDGKKKAVLNKEETAIAQGKQDLIKQAFQDWIWQNPERRQRLTAYYNENFNAIRPREYDGSHLNFYGMNPEIQLRQHQKNGAARIIYGGNSLLAYVVGAGKTYTMVAAAMECKRLGLCNKSMIVVPNHIIEQFAAEWLQLYPAANLLVATKKDFETKNRKKFCARIATSDIDAVIIGHSQFEKVPLSTERQQRMLEEQIEEIIDGIAEAKRNGGSRFTIKQMEKSKKSLQTKLSKLNDQSRKDDVVFFEELGVDRLFVDEADGYKNLYLYTKMRNVGGIAQTEAQKSSDMFMKCRYLDGITGGKGVIFATGTPVSNSMVELYTMQRYLQYNTLVRNHLQHFDAWASTFGETVSAIELAPEGSGYRMKTRFAKFYNLPELMMMFREVADIQTADMLNLPVPEAEYKVVAVKPSEIQKDMVQTLGERAERVRNGMVNPMQDNMLLITNDGRKLALDQRLTNEMLPDEPESKVNACVNEVYQFWEKGKEQKLTQLLFCDLSTPKNDGTFSVYNDVRDKLIAKGIPPQEIEFIHDANTEVRKKELFSKVRRGAVRILMGSTFKMGAGTNVQNLIIASHDLDCPWRPRDLEQRGGRTIRQGNQNKKVFIVRYVTEGTFDAYMYQMIENKQKFISQIMTSKSPARTIEDIDEVALSYAEIKALATGNPYIKEKMDLDIQVSKLQLLKQSFLSQRYEMEDKVTKYYPMEIKRQSQWIVEYQQDIEQVKAHTPPDRDTFPPMQINGVTYGEKKEAGQAIIAACKAMSSPDPVPLGAYRGLAMELSYSTFSKDFVITLQGKRAYHVTLGTDIHGNITRLDNEIEKFGDNLSRCEEHLETLKAQLENAKIETVKEFPKEQELAEKTARLGELNALLDMDKKENIVLDVEPEEEETEPEKGSKDRER